MGNLQNHFDNLGCRNITTCINSDNLDLIEQIINNILKHEGYHRISKPPLPENSKPLLQKLLSCPWKMRDLWVIGLSVGNLGWTVIKTSIPELFCLRAKGSIRPRLAELARQIGCNAFFYEVHDRYLGGLLEANASGQVFVSGYLDSYGIEDMRLHNEPIIEIAGGLNFYLLDVSEEFKTLNQLKTNLSEEEKQKREEELEALVEKHPEQIEKALFQWKKIMMSGFQQDDENLEQLLCKSDSFWHEDNLLYKAFAEPQKLQEDGVRLLFFQVGGFSHQPDTEEIWEQITKMKNYGIDISRDNIPF